MALTFRVIATAAGMVGFVRSERGLRRIVLPQSSAAQVRAEVARLEPEAREDAHAWPELTDLLQRYFAGEPVEFHLPLDWSGHSLFEVDAWRACAEVGYGQTCTYGQLAERIGRPGGARAVGLAMSQNPMPVVVPCHRVLRSDGSLGGYSGPGGVSFKRRLLDMEAAAAHALVG